MIETLRVLDNLLNTCNNHVRIDEDREFLALRKNVIAKIEVLLTQIK